MSDTDDTDVLVLIPPDFFTVSSSEDERPLTEISRPVQHKFYSSNMSQDKMHTPMKPSNVTSPYKNGENFPKRSLDYYTYHSPQKSDYSPQISPSKALPSYVQYQNSRCHQAGGVIPKTGVLTTHDTSSPMSRLRRSTSDLPTTSDSNNTDTNLQGNTQRQRSLTGEILWSGLEIRENHTSEPTTEEKTTEINRPKYFKNPEQPEYDTNPSPQNIVSDDELNPKPIQHEKSPQPYTGEHQSLPYVCGDNVGSIPDLGFGLREFLSSLKPAYPQSARTPSEAVHEEPCIKKTFYSLGSEASPNIGPSISRRQLNFDEHTEAIPSQNDVKPDKLTLGSIKRPSAFVPVVSGNTRIIGEHQPASLPSDMSRPELTGSSTARSPSVTLPSLTQLWRDEITHKTPITGSSLLQQKLEEEKYRRLHCEQLICELQQKLLRESERVAVATQVDARKDNYLEQLRERYDTTARHWQAERERLLADITEKNEMCASTIQRLRGCERELSKALDLASGFQQRSLELEREKVECETTLQARVLSLERHCGLLEQEVMKHRAAASISEQQENKRGDQMAALQNLLEDERESRRQIESENKRLLREAEDKEATALTLEAERDAQKSKLQDFKQRCEILEQQKTALQQSLEEFKKKERAARQEVRELSQAMEQSRQSLKEQYQAQLDEVVRAKLAEFQAQLDRAETALRQQWENREAEARSKHTKALSDTEQRHLGELRQVEERHSRDIAWWQRSLSQAMSQIQELTSELERQEKHREQLAGKIRSMLQAQYQQATTLIWEPQKDEANTMPKMNGTSSEFKGWGSLPSMNQCGTGRSQAQPATSTSENQLSEAGNGTKTVLSNHAQAELKKYIEMLLQRPAGDPLLSSDQGTSSKTSYIPELDLSRLSINFPEKSKPSKDNQKPPWK